MKWKVWTFCLLVLWVAGLAWRVRDGQGISGITILFDGVQGAVFAFLLYPIVNRVVGWFSAHAEGTQPRK